MSKQLINGIEEIPLSGDDLLKIAECLNMKTAKWMLYDDLAKFKTIDELFENDKYNAIYILLLIKSNKVGAHSVGHWVCFINHSEKDEYYWYDSYGIKMSEELSFTHEPDFIIQLTKGLNLTDVNRHRHQQFRDAVNTCGRHCVLRSVFWHLDNDEYNNLVIKPSVPSIVKTADQMVALITGLASKSDEILIEFFNKKEK